MPLPVGLVLKARSLVLYWFAVFLNKRNPIRRVSVLKSLSTFLPTVLKSFPAPVEKINRELSRLEDEESSAENLLLERQRQVNEALARISRLRQMQKQLRKKGVEMLKKGLDDMEELEEEERKEAEEKVVGRSWSECEFGKPNLYSKSNPPVPHRWLIFPAFPLTLLWRTFLAELLKAVLLILLLPVELAD
uniref:Uncharacterized protein n=1 Tax=Bionectria ochroleuca TaxID=29856 RepID=A0A8H7NPR2_BIOOC